MKIEEVIKKYTIDLVSIPGVIGTGQGLFGGESCVMVFVVKMTPELKDKIPEELEGYSVRIKETGLIRVRP